MLDIIADVLTVFFIIDIVLLVVVILMQNKGEGMGLFASANTQTAFGSSSGDILTKTTGILTTAFFILGFGLMYLRASDFEELTLPEYAPARANAPIRTQTDLQGNIIEEDTEDQEETAPGVADPEYLPEPPQGQQTADETQTTQQQGEATTEQINPADVEQMLEGLASEAGIELDLQVNQSEQQNQE